MLLFLSYLFTLSVILISVLVTLYFKSELERMFREKKAVLAFHVCNVVIILMVAFVTHAVTTIYLLGNELRLVRHLIFLVLLILLVYVIGHFAFEKYKVINRKYFPANNGKVLIINDKYLKKKGARG